MGNPLRMWDGLRYVLNGLIMCEMTYICKKLHKYLGNYLIYFYHFIPVPVTLTLVGHKVTKSKTCLLHILAHCVIDKGEI